MTIDPNNLSSTATLSFDDEFNSLSLWDGGASGTWATNFWWAPTYGNGSTLSSNGEQEWYINNLYPQTASAAPWTVSNGTLTITAAKAAASIQPYIDNYQYTSGEINSYHSFSQTYGYFEMRAELPAGQGYWPAFYLLPENGAWPPELDVMEMLGNDPTTLYMTVHSNSTGTHTQNGAAITVANMSTGFHTYGVDWEPDTITWYFDGQQVYQTATPPDLNTPMYIIADFAVGGYWPGMVDSTTPFPGQMQIDYIRAYTAPPLAALALFTLPTSSAWTDMIYGNSRSNVLVGTAAADHIDGKGGSDTMSGGAGDDTYVIDRPSDVVNESSNNGIDTVLSTASSFTLPGNIENLKLVGSSSQTVWGNALSNILTSNDYASKLNGGEGNDILIAGHGANTLTGGAGSDIFRFDFLPKSAGHVADFVSGVDMLDFRGLFAAAGYVGADPILEGHLRFASDGLGDTRISFDTDGSAGKALPVLITTLDHVVPTAQIDWFFH
jgi:beta-glucanase (GH16 family)